MGGPLGLRIPFLCRNLDMPLFLALIFHSPPVQTGELNRLIDGVERSFARMTDFLRISSSFRSIEPKQQESGHLYLKKPGMMRWEYKNLKRNCLSQMERQSFSMCRPIVRSVRKPLGRLLTIGPIDVLAGPLKFAE
jgi:hypothetical protein